MQHTIAAVFNSQTQAQQACEALISAGFPRNEVHLSQSETSADSDRLATDQEEHDESLSDSIKSFFADLFGQHNPREADLYSDAVRQGNYVLTVNVPDDDQVDQAAEVLDHYHPLDVQDQESNWKSGGWAAADSMRQSSSASDTLQRTSSSATLTYTPSASPTPSTPTVQEELDLGQRTAQQRSGVRVYPRGGESQLDTTANLRDEPLFMDSGIVEPPIDMTPPDLATASTTATAQPPSQPSETNFGGYGANAIVPDDAGQRQQLFNATPRSTDAAAQQFSGTQSQSGSFEQDNDASYRSHWNSTYAAGSEGGSYDEYEPAYRYGSSLSGSDRYQGRKWDEIEPDARSDWETRNPGSAWEKVKAAVRHGWDRMTTKVQ